MISREIRLYSESYNAGDKLHYAFSNVSNYLTELSPALIGTIGDASYQITRGAILIKPTTNIPQFAIMGACYAAVVEKDEDFNLIYYTAFYFVRRIYKKSEFLVLDVEMDNWASFFAKARFSNMHVVRSNKNLGIGTQDDPPRTTNALLYVPWFDYDQHGKMSIANVYLVMNLRHNVEENIFGNETITTDMLVAIRLDDLDAAITATISQNFTILELAARFCGGVYGVDNLIGWANLDAKITQAWLIPAFYVHAYTDVTLKITLAAKMPYNGGNKVSVDVYPVKTSRDFGVYDVSTLDRNHKWYAGGLNNGLDFSLTTQANRRLFVYYDISANDVTISIVDGTNQKDITAEFELPILGFSDVSDELRKISFWAKKLSTTISRGYSIATQKTSAGMAVKAVTGALDEVSELTASKGGLNGQDGHGDAFLNYACGVDNGWKYLIGRTQDVYSPLCFIGFPSIRDEEDYIKRKGVSFDLFIDSLTTLFSASYIITGTTQVYVQIDEADIEGVNSSAVEYIKAEFSRGVYIKSV